MGEHASAGEWIGKRSHDRCALKSGRVGSKARSELVSSVSGEGYNQQVEGLIDKWRGLVD